ncbi:MAG TPA: hypothetical protein VFO85_17315 [Vicinamibacteria bacterium]|nr:hypothetical protein [Vicinamibacteria bacterium]
MALSQARLLRARRRGLEAELEQRRRSSRVMAFEHAALALAIACGLALMSLHGWRLGYPRWLSIKLGLVAFLLIPLEGMHAWVNHVWMARALRAWPGPPAPLSRELDRWTGMDDMIRTLAALLLGLALPFMAWLSIARPF